MSTRVYKGHRLARDTDLFVFMARARELANVVRDRLDDVLITGLGSVRHDDMLFGASSPDGPAAKGCPVDAAVLDWETAQRTRGTNDFGSDPHGFELAFVPDPDSRWIAVLPYFEPSAYYTVLDVLRREFDFEAYEYWNNADPDDDVAEAEWEQRGLFWGRVLTTGPVTDTCLTLTLRADKWLFMRLIDWRHDHAPDISTYVADCPRRAGHLAEYLVRQAFQDDAVRGDLDRKDGVVFGPVRPPTAAVADLVLPLLEPLTLADLTNPVTPLSDETLAPVRAAATQCATEWAAQLRASKKAKEH